MTQIVAKEEVILKDSFCHKIVVKDGCVKQKKKN